MREEKGYQTISITIMSDASMDIIEKTGMVLNYTISSNGINNNSEENNIGN